MGARLKMIFADTLQLQLAQKVETILMEMTKLRAPTGGAKFPAILLVEMSKFRTRILFEKLNFSLHMIKPLGELLVKMLNSRQLY